MSFVRTVVIMAGGSGERFYPSSRIRKPKQLLRLVSDTKTMIEEAVERIEPLVNRDNIFIITSEILQEPIRAVLSSIPPQNIIAEPAKRNTAPCLALSAVFVAERFAEKGISAENISMAVLTADHFMRPADKFRQTVDTALTHAEVSGDLVTIGIVPTRPETGYGYIQTENNNEIIKRALAFKEKPDSETAQRYIANESFFWNSGMFFWRVDTFLNELQKHAPAIAVSLPFISELLHNKTNTVFSGAPKGVAELFDPLPNISIDYAIMEKSEHIAVVPSNFSWDDVGSWDALYRTKEQDARGNVCMGNTLLIDCENTIAVNESSGNKIVALIGMNETVVVETDDVTVVCPAGRVQEVKKIVETLRAEGKKEFL